MAAKMTVAELEVIVSAKIDQMRREMLLGLSEVKQFASKLDDELEGSKKKADRRLRDIGRSARDFGNKLTLGLTVPLTAAVGTAIKASASMEGYRASMKSVLGSAAAAGKQLSDLEGIARRTANSYDLLTRASLGVITGFDGNTREANFVLEQFSKLANVLNISRPDFERLSINLTQIAGASRLTGDELRETAAILPNIRILLKQTFGTAASEELAKMGVTGREALLRIAKAIEDTKLVANTETFNAQLQNAQTEFFKLKAAAGDVILPLANDILRELVPAMRDLANWFKQLDPEERRMLINTVAITAALGPLVRTVGSLIATYASIRAWHLMVQAESAKTAVATKGATASLAGLRAALGGPLGLFVAAVGVSFAGFKLIEHLDDAADASKRLRSETLESANAWEKEAKAKAANAEKSSGLLKEIEQLRDRLQHLKEGTQAASDVMADLRAKQNALAAVAPHLISGFDAQGNAVIKLAADYRTAAAEALSYAKSARIAAAVKVGLRRQDLVDMRQRLREEVAASFGDVSGVHNPNGSLDPFATSGVTMFPGVGRSAASSREFAKQVSERRAKIESLTKQIAELDQAIKDTLNPPQNNESGGAFRLPQFDRNAKKPKPKAGGKKRPYSEIMLDTLQGLRGGIGAGWGAAYAPLIAAEEQAAEAAKRHAEDIAGLHEQYLRLKGATESQILAWKFETGQFERLEGETEAQTRLRFEQQMQVTMLIEEEQRYQTVYSKGVSLAAAMASAVRKAVEEQRKRAQQLKEDARQEFESMRQRIDTLNLTTAAQKIEYEVTKGKYRELPALMKVVLIAQAKELDQAEQLKRKREDAAEVQEQYRAYMANLAKEAALLTARTDDARLSVQLLNEAFAADPGKLQAAKEATLQLQALKRQVEELERYREMVSRTFETMFDDIFDNGFKGFANSLLGGFRKLFLDIAREILMSQVRGAIGSILGGFFSIGGSAFGLGGSVLGGIGAGIAAGVNGGGRAIGGDIKPGRFYRVGEHGPETILPTAGGRVLTAQQSEIAAGGVTVNISINATDAKSVIRSADQIAAKLGAAVTRATMYS